MLRRLALFVKLMVLVAVACDTPTEPGPGPAPIASVEIDPADGLMLAVGATWQLSATVRAPDGTILDGRLVTWTSLKPSVASVDAGGRVKAQAQGTATIIATSGTKSARVTVSVWRLYEPVVVTPVDVTPHGLSLPLGASTQLSATPRDAESLPVLGRAVVWESLNPLVVTVNQNGGITAVGAGEIPRTSRGKFGCTSGGARWLTFPHDVPGHRLFQL